MRSKALIAIACAILAAPFAPASEAPVPTLPGSLEVTVAIHSNVASFDASVQGDDLSITADAEEKTIDSLVYTFEWTGVKTGDHKRDRVMLEWAGAEEHPKGTFTLKSIDPNGDSYTAKGSLEFHGVSRDIEIPVDFVQAGSELIVSGRVAIDYRDWGLKLLRKFLIFVVDPVVTVKFKFKVPVPDGLIATAGLQIGSRLSVQRQGP